MSFEDVKKHLLKNKSLSENSLKTYTNQLKTLFNSIWKNEDFNYKYFFDKSDKVLEKLKSIENINTRKTKTAALVILTGDKSKVVKKYRDLMSADLEKYNNEIKQNKMNDKQKENWIDLKEVNSIYNNLKKKYKDLWNKEKLTADELLDLQKIVILSLYVLIPPRRLKDYLDFKLKNYDKETDNYVDKNELIFNSYKTAKFHGQDKVALPLTLKKIINKWKTKNNNDFLLIDFYGKQLKAPALTKILNSIFKKNISVNMLRHIFITENVGPKIKELEKVAQEMGHTMNEQKNYVKN
jgi:hypothetical protein